jgi:hypothetical protein
MKKYSYYLDEAQIEKAKSLLVPYEKEVDFVRTAIDNEIEKRKNDKKKDSAD